MSLRHFPRTWSIPPYDRRTETDFLDVRSLAITIKLIVNSIFIVISILTFVVAFVTNRMITWKINPFRSMRYKQITDVRENLWFHKRNYRNERKTKIYFLQYEIFEYFRVLYVFSYLKVLRTRTNIHNRIINKWSTCYLNAKLLQREY